MNFSNKVIVFLLGLSVGLLAGAGFFILKVDEYISKMEFFKGGKDTVYSITKTEPKEIIKYIETDKLKNKSGHSDSVSRKNDSSNVNITAKNTDSLRTDTTTVVRYSGNDDIVVMKDELLVIKNIAVANFHNENKNTKDSLLHKESGIRDDSKKQIASYKVEFWQSPINYKGYKLINNKIILFGIAKDETPLLYKFDDVVYIKVKQLVYKLDQTNDFKPFETIKDQNLLAKIK